VNNEGTEGVWVFDEIAAHRWVLDRSKMVVAPLPECAGSPVHPSLAILSFTHNRSTWSQCVRNSPKPISAEDFAVLTGAIRMFASERSTT
jgi:hypothetical protein